MSSGAFVCTIREGSNHYDQNWLVSRGSGLWSRALCPLGVCLCRALCPSSGTLPMPSTPRLACAGRVENAQFSTWAVWATGAGHALIDYEVYLHKEWFAEGDARFGTTHAPGPVAKRTKGQQVAEVLRRLLAGPVRPKAVTATDDEVYGNSPHLRRGLYDSGLPFVLACAAPTKLRTDPLIDPIRVDDLAMSVPTRNWQVHAVGKGAEACAKTPGAGSTSTSPRRPPGTATCCPPEPRHRRAGVLSLLVTRAEYPARPGHPRRSQMGDRGIVSAGQRPRRSRPAPSPDLGGNPPAPDPRHGRLPDDHANDHRRPRRPTRRRRT